MELKQGVWIVRRGTRQFALCCLRARRKATQAPQKLDFIDCKTGFHCGRLISAGPTRSAHLSPQRARPKSRRGLRPLGSPNLTAMCRASCFHIRAKCDCSSERCSEAAARWRAHLVGVPGANTLYENHALFAGVCGRRSFHFHVVRRGGNHAGLNYHYDHHAAHDDDRPGRDYHHDESYRVLNLGSEGRVR